MVLPVTLSAFADVPVIPEVDDTDWDVSGRSAVVDSE